MADKRLYIVHGMGSDAVGLVGAITAPIAEADGNIVDLRQDVLHGLFTIFMVVDLSASALRIDDLKKMVSNISEDTGLSLSVDKYIPIPRVPEKQNMLLIILGNDRRGIISAMSKLLGKYKINIEVSQNIAREGVFLTELMMDISRSSIPLDSLKDQLRKEMDIMGMQTIFQTDDVFNKKKRVILFNIAASLMDADLRSELVLQTDIETSDINNCYSPGNLPGSLQKAAALLEGFPVEVLNSIIDGISVTHGTLELIQTFKTMGYKVALVSTGFSLFTDALQRKLDIKYCFGVDLPVDDDYKTVTGVLAQNAWQENRLETIIGSILNTEGIAREDLTVVSDAGLVNPPGIHLQYDQVRLLDYYNKRVMNKENLLGLMGSFGVPSP